MRKRRGRGRRGRGRPSRSFYENGVHGNGPLSGSSANLPAVAGGDSVNAIIGVEGDEKGPKKKVRCCFQDVCPPSLSLFLITAARRETTCLSAEGEGRSDQEESRHASNHPHSQEDSSAPEEGEGETDGEAGKREAGQDLQTERSGGVSVCA